MYIYELTVTLHVLQMVVTGFSTSATILYMSSALTVNGQPKGFGAS